jgi:hypothetical protein
MRSHGTGGFQMLFVQGHCCGPLFFLGLSDVDFFDTFIGSVGEQIQYRAYVVNPGLHKFRIGGGVSNSVNANDKQSRLQCQLIKSEQPGPESNMSPLCRPPRVTPSL